MSEVREPRLRSPRPHLRSHRKKTAEKCAFPDEQLFLGNFPLPKRTCTGVSVKLRLAQMRVPDLCFKHAGQRNRFHPPFSPRTVVCYYCA